MEVDVSERAVVSIAMHACIMHASMYVCMGKGEAAGLAGGAHLQPFVFRDLALAHHGRQVLLRRHVRDAIGTHPCGDIRLEANHEAIDDGIARDDLSDFLHMAL